jgi:hypothetical protein
METHHDLISLFAHDLFRKTGFHFSGSCSRRQQGRQVRCGEALRCDKIFSSRCAIFSYPPTLPCALSHAQAHLCSLIGLAIWLTRAEPTPILTSSTLLDKCRQMSGPCIVASKVRYFPQKTTKRSAASGHEPQYSQSANHVGSTSERRPERGLPNLSRWVQAV